MLHIILTILKLIGILLLVLLALILLLVATVLFVPVKYRANGEKQDDSFYVKGEVYWLFHLFRLKAVYPEPGQVTAKLLWFTLFDSEKDGETQKADKKKRKKKKKKSGDLPEETKQDLAEEVKQKAPENTEQELSEDTKQKLPENKEKNLSEDAKQDFFEEMVEDDDETTGKIGQIFRKIKAIVQRVLGVLKNIRYTITRVCDKIKAIFADVQYYKEVLQEEETKRAFSLCKHQLYRIWKNIKPSKMKVELKVGTGEPDTTGYILAVHGMLFPLVGNTIAIEPDFENQVVEGKFKVKGHITVFVFVRVALKVFFDKDIRYFLKRLKREE